MGNKSLGSMDGVFKQGYGLIPKQVMRDKDLSVEAKAVYAYLSSFTGAGRTAYPSVSLMISELNISKNRFYNHRKQLLDKGYIKITKNRNEEGWSNNIYTLVSNPRLCFEDTRNEDIQNEDIQNEDTIINSSNINSTNSNSINTSSSAELTERFEKLWKLYPRKQGKRDALRHYKRAIKEGTTDQEIERGIKSYIREIKITNTKKQFIRHGSAWFNQHGWEDEYLGGSEKEQKDEPTTDFDDLSSLLGVGE